MDKQRHDATLELIDNALHGNTSVDAMRWTPDPGQPATEECGCALCVSPPDVAARAVRIAARRNPDRPSRRPATDPARPGYQVVPFIGGPWHCDLRAMPLPLPYTWNVASPVDVCALFDVPPHILEIPHPVLYHLQTVWLAGSPAGTWPARSRCTPWQVRRSAMSKTR